MITILKNNLYRTCAKPSLLMTTLILTAGAIAAAMFFSARSEATASIAIVSDDEPDLPDAAHHSLNVTSLHTAPPQSSLLSGTYDAIVTVTDEGTYDIQTIKSEETASDIRQLLETGTMPVSTSHQRGTGATIIGFLLMFLLMQSSSLMCLFGEDKEHRQITRVLSSPVSIWKYLFSHSIFNFLYIFTATLGILYIIKWVTGTDIGFRFPQYCFLIGLILSLGTVFSLLLNALTVKSDNANMIGASLIVITTVLSGSFYSFDKGNDLLGQIIRFLPQKVLLTIVEQMEQAHALSSFVHYLLYPGGFLLICGTIAILKTRNDYVQK